MIRKGFIAAAAVLWLTPFVIMVLIALNQTNTTSFSALLDPSSMGFGNFVNAWQEGQFSTGFFNTLIVTVVSVAGILLLSAMAGYALSRFSFRSKQLLTALMAMTVLIPTVFFTIPVYQILRMVHADTSLAGLILAEVGGGHVIFILMFRQFFDNLPNELTESARMDGCSEFQMFWKIFFPISRPIVAAVVITQSIWTWNSFLFPLILSLNNPAIRTLSVGMYSFQGEHIVNWGAMAAAGCITVLPVVILFVCFQKYFINGMEGAVKG